MVEAPRGAAVEEPPPQSGSGPSQPWCEKVNVFCNQDGPLDLWRDGGVGVQWIETFSVRPAALAPVYC